VNATERALGAAAAASAQAWSTTARFTCSTAAGRKRIQRKTRLPVDIYGVQAQARAIVPGALRRSHLVDSWLFAPRHQFHPHDTLRRPKGCPSRVVTSEAADLCADLARTRSSWSSGLQRHLSRPNGGSAPGYDLASLPINSAGLSASGHA